MDEAYDRGAGGAPLGSAVGGSHRSVLEARSAGVGTTLPAAAEGALDRRRAFGAMEEVLQLTSRLVVPGARVGGRRLRPDTSRFGPLVSRLEEGDAIQDGAIQRRQVLGGRVGVHWR